MRYEPGQPRPEPTQPGEEQPFHRWRQILDALPVGVIVMNPAGNVVLSNAASSRIWGGVILSADERYARSKGFAHGSGQPIAPDGWGSVRALTRGETTLNELIDIDTFDGKRRTIQNSAAPIRDDQGAIVGAVVVNEDVTEHVTERKLAEQELLRRSRRQAAIAQLSLHALSADSIEPLFRDATALMASTLEVEVGIVMESLAEGSALVLRAGAGPIKEATIGRATAKNAADLMGWYCMRTKAPVVVEDLAGETRFAPCELLLSYGVKSGITVPILGKTAPFGVLGAHTTKLRKFSDDEVGFVWSIANILATSIDQKRTAHELDEKRERLQSLSRRLLDAQEAERRAVARELHDDFGAMLTAIKLNLQRKDWSAPKARLENLELVDQAIKQMRELALDLRPAILDDLGLAEAVRWYATRETQRAGLGLELDLEDVDGRLPVRVATACFRLVQEALTNVVRHAGARTVSVALRAAGESVLVEVRDDGAGFDVSAARRAASAGKSQGLLSMQERAELSGGSLSIDSAPGKGTLLRATLLVTGGGER